MKTLPRAPRWLLAVGLAGSLASAGPAQAQAYAPGASLQPVLLTDAYLAEAGWLLVPTGSTLDLHALASTPEARRMAAYREFERRLLSRTQGIVGGAVSVDERRQAKRRMLAGIGKRLEDLPGAALVVHGERVWRAIESRTDFAFDGYRLRLRVDEAVEGKIALKLQKKFR